MTSGLDLDPAATVQTTVQYALVLCLCCSLVGIASTAAAAPIGGADPGDSCQQSHVLHDWATVSGEEVRLTYLVSVPLCPSGDSTGLIPAA